MSARIERPARTLRAVAVAACLSGSLLSAGAFSQETVWPVHVPTAGIVAPIERLALGTHYQLDDVGRTEPLKDGLRVLQQLSEQRYCVPLLPRVAEQLNSRVSALNLVETVTGETETGAYLVFMAIDGLYGEVWVVHRLVADTELTVACLTAVVVYASNT